MTSGKDKPGASRSRGDATRERLLEAAVELLEEGGYAAASVATITARSGVSAGALYRHFPSKAELFVEVFRSAAEEELAALREASSGPATRENSKRSSRFPAALALPGSLGSRLRRSTARRRERLHSSDLPRGAGDAAACRVAPASCPRGPALPQRR